MLRKPPGVVVFPGPGRAGGGALAKGPFGGEKKSELKGGGKKGGEKRKRGWGKGGGGQRGSFPPQKKTPTFIKQSKFPLGRQKGKKNPKAFPPKQKPPFPFCKPNFPFFGPGF